MSIWWKVKLDGIIKQEIDKYYKEIIQKLFILEINASKNQEN